MKDPKFTKKELFAMWTAVCTGSRFFQSRLYTFVLKEKLHKMLTEEEHRTFRRWFEINPTQQHD